MNKILSVLFLICFALTACTINADIKSDPTTVSSTFESATEADLAYSEMINQQFDQLVEHWNGSYPDYYCGCYIDNGNFYILVNCDPDEVKNEICSSMGNPDVNVLKAKYSYNDLMNNQKQIEDIIFEQSKSGNEAAKKVIGIGTSEKDNIIDIEVLNMTDEDKTELQKLLSNNEMIRFINTDDPGEEL